MNMAILVQWYDPPHFYLTLSGFDWSARKDPVALTAFDQSEFKVLVHFIYHDAHRRVQ